MAAPVGLLLSTEVGSEVSALQRTAIQQIIGRWPPEVEGMAEWSKLVASGSA
jgi:hypothetical protein